MKLSWRVRELALREPLRISRSVMDRRGAVEVAVEHEGVRGLGEVVTSVYYGLDVARIGAELAAFAPVLADAGSPEEAMAALPTTAAPGVLAAVDAALHDLVGHLRGVPVHLLIGHPEWTPVATAATIGVVDAGHAERTAAGLAARGFSVLKVKAGGDPADDLARVAAVRRGAPRARLLLDANGAWTPEQAVRVLDRVGADVEAVEQPIPPGTPDALGWVGARSPVPVIADEDAATTADVRRVAGAVGGVNVKLAKCGGVTAALEIVETARAHGMDVMLGCLVASSLGIAPAAHLTGHARWVDLDGHLLLAEDPWTGLGGEDGVLRLAGGPGLGVAPRGRAG